MSRVGVYVVWASPLLRPGVWELELADAVYAIGRGKRVRAAPQSKRGLGRMGDAFSSRWFEPVIPS